ncbi:MAG: AGE family epimerase/isomerase [Balneola sp.]
MEHEVRLKNLQCQLIREFKENILSYWFKNTLDIKNGGFVGQVNARNQPCFNANKHGILNSRILWSFSYSYKNLHDEDSKYLAHRAYNYFTKNFFDNEYGGTYWELDHLGKVVDSRKHVYAQAFSIYALVEYYSAFNKKEALDKAIEIYTLIESKCKDHEYGGYYEAYCREWVVIDDVRLSEKDEDEPKSMNTHLHVLEAYTSLYRHHPTSEIRTALEEIIHLFLDSIISNDNRTFHCFFSEKWQPRSEVISLGHDIEASWLLTEAIEVLNDENLLVQIKPIVAAIADHVILYGMDSDGGLINEINLNSKNDVNKDWWPQAEALVGFMNAFQLTSNPKYLEALFKSWEFLNNSIIDKKGGEWFEKANRAGIPYNNMDKVRAWKAPYHNSRALFEVSNRISETIKTELKPNITANVSNF